MLPAPYLCVSGHFRLHEMHHEPQHWACLGTACRHASMLLYKQLRQLYSIVAADTKTTRTSTSYVRQPTEAGGA